jgi:hypothetical protein
VVSAKKASTRKIAELLSKRGHTTAYIAGQDKRISAERYLAIQLWNIITHGKLVLSEGQEILVDDFRDWITVVKFVTEHIEGTARDASPVGDDIPIKGYAIISPTDWDAAIKEKA